MRKEIPIETNTWVENALECVYSALAIALVAVAAWLFLIATPDQCSAECELIRAEMMETR